MDKKTEDDWKKTLTPEQYRICRQAGTEPPFSGDLLHNKAPGEYRCIACAQLLFDAATKFDSGSGWPSFYQPKTSDAILERTDMKLGMMRTEVICANCHAHLGHVFEDGPQPTGLRYCINSIALNFKHQDELEKP